MTLRVVIDVPFNPVSEKPDEAQKTRETLATLEDLKGIADLIRGKDVMVMSDEPYAHMVWEGRHHSILECPGMIDQAVAVFTFSKSYSMSGYRVGFGITKPEYADLIGKLINTSLSCVPPITQLAAQAALDFDMKERDETMLKFKKKVEILVAALKKVPDVTVEMPKGTFYVFPNVSKICQRLGITSHGLAMFLLEAHRLLSRAKRSAAGESVVLAPMRLFHLSITYLTLLFTAVAVDPFLRIALF